MKELGKYLKSIRESQNLILDDVAESTKIHKYKLMAIEEGNKSALPAKVFCVGLIKSYARQINADMKKVDQLCEEAFREDSFPLATDKQTNPVRNDEEPSESQPVGRFQIPKTVGIIISLFVIALLIFGIYLVVEKLNSYSDEEALPPSVYDDSESNKIEETPQIVEESSKKAEEESDSPAPPKIEKNSQSQSKATLAKIKPIPEVEKTKKSAPTKEFEENNNFSDKDEDSNTTVVESDNKLVITALEPIRAEIIWADGFVQVMLLKSNESKTLVFSTPIKVKVNNGGALQVSFNDSRKKIPGTFNKPIELKYP